MTADDQSAETKAGFVRPSDQLI